MTTTCEKCGAGQATYNAMERWKALERVAVESGPEFLHRCRHCGSLWCETLRALFPISAEAAERRFPSLQAK